MSQAPTRATRLHPTRARGRGDIYEWRRHPADAARLALAVLAGLLAESHGVDVASVRGVGETAEGDGLTAFEALDGVRLVDLSPEVVDDALLGACWQELKLAHQGGLAHRWFDTSHVLVGVDGRPRILDWRWADVGATRRLLAPAYAGPT